MKWHGKLVSQLHTFAYAHLYIKLRLSIKLRHAYSCEKYFLALNKCRAVQVDAYSDSF